MSSFCGISGPPERRSAIRDGSCCSHGTSWHCVASRLHTLTLPMCPLLQAPRPLQQAPAPTPTSTLLGRPEQACPRP